MAEYIDRHALKNDGHLCWHDGKGNVFYEVDHAPAADVVEVRHGEWILSNTNPYGDPNIVNRTQKICSCCGWMNACRYACCPNCGAKMDGATDTNVGGKMDGKG